MYSNLVDKLKNLNEEVSGMVGMQTTSGNPSVDYLPGGFTTMRNMLNSLSPVKKAWKLEVIDEKGKDRYNVKIEDALSINIAKKDYDEFNNKVIDTTNKKELNLTEMLNEDIQSEIQANLKRIHRALVLNLKKNPQIFQTIVLLNSWIRLFPKFSTLPKASNVLIDLYQPDKDIQTTVEYIKKLYGDDLGKLESLVDALEKRSPLNQFPPFSSYEYLVKTNLKTDYQGVEIQIDLGVDSSFHTIQNIKINDESLLEELKVIKTIKIVQNNITPIHNMFSPGDLLMIKKVLDDAINV